MDPQDLPSFCVYYMCVGYAVAAGLHLIGSVAGVFKSFVGDALMGK